MISHTAPLNLSQVAKLRCLLEARGFEFAAKEHTIFAAKKEKLSVSVYHKGPKVLVQGKDTEDFVKFTLGPEIIGETLLQHKKVSSADAEHYSPHFGIDESGKGDFFGPLVIAGVYTDEVITRSLIRAGVQDSKCVSTPAGIRKLAAIIKATPGIEFDVITLRPEIYNETYATFQNLNRMLAWGHATVIEELIRKIPDCPRALSDQFARADVLQSALKKKNITIKLDQRTKGESDTAVAAASILARERFIDWMDAAAKKTGLPIPLGCSDKVVKAGKNFVKTYGEDALRKFAKLHFKTTKQVCGR